MLRLSAIATLPSGPTPSTTSHARVLSSGLNSNNNVAAGRGHSLGPHPLSHNALFFGNEGPPGNKPLVQAQATADGLARIEQMISNLQVPPANLQPVMDAIAALKADLDSLTLKKV